MSNVIHVDFGKVDEIEENWFDDDRPVYLMTVSWQSPGWWARLRRAVGQPPERGK